MQKVVDATTRGGMVDAVMQDIRKNIGEAGSPPPENEKLLTPQAFGEHSALGATTVLKLVKQGKVRALRINKRVVRIPASELQRLAALAL